MDITKPDEVAAMMTAVGERWGRLDGLVHVAALDTPVGGLEDGDLDDWDRVSQVNVRGTLEVTKAALGLLGPGEPVGDEHDHALTVAIRGHRPAPALAAPHFDDRLARPGHYRLAWPRFGFTLRR